MANTIVPTTPAPVATKLNVGTLANGAPDPNYVPPKSGVAVPTAPPATTPTPAPAPIPTTPVPTTTPTSTPAFTSKAPVASTPQQSALTWYQGVINGTTPYNPADPNASTYLQTLAQMGVAGASNIQALGASGVGRAQQNYQDAQGQISDRINNAQSNINNILANGQNTPQQQAAVQAQIAGIQGYLNVAANYGIPLTGIAYQDANGNWLAGTAAAPSAALAGNAVNANGTAATPPASTPAVPSANGGNSGTTPSTTSAPATGTTAPPAPLGNGSTSLAGGGTTTPVQGAAGSAASGSAVTLADAGGSASGTGGPPAGSTYISDRSQLAGLTENQIYRSPDGKIYALPGVTPGGGGGSFGSTGTGGGSTGSAPVSTQVPGASMANGTPGSSGNPPGSIADLKAQIAYFQGQVIAASQPSADETTIQNELDTLNAQQEAITSSNLLGDVNVQGQPIAQAFVTGQQAALQRQADAQSAALGVSQTNDEDQLKELQAKRATALDVAQEEEQFAEENYAAAAPTPVALGQGQELVNPLTGSVVAGNAPKPTVVGSTTVYDDNGNAIKINKYNTEDGTLNTPVIGYGNTGGTTGTSGGSTTATGGGLGSTGTTSSPTSSSTMTPGFNTSKPASTPAPASSSTQQGNYQDAQGNVYYIPSGGSLANATLISGPAKSGTPATTSTSPKSPPVAATLSPQFATDGSAPPNSTEANQPNAAYGGLSATELYQKAMDSIAGIGSTSGGGMGASRGPLLAQNRAIANKAGAILAAAGVTGPEAQAQYGYATTPATQSKAQAINAALPNFPTIVGLAQTQGNNSLQAINELLLNAGIQTGNTTAANLGQAQSLIADDVSKILSGGGSPSDQKTTLALTSVDPSLTVDQFVSNMEQLQGFVMNQSNAMSSQAGLFSSSLNLPISVTSPNGQTGYITPDQLQDALSQGYTKN